jgi:DNA-binding LytR/AlgR family response regulator
MREIYFSQEWRQRLAIDGSVVILLSLTGPFGTFVDLSALPRLAYWIIAAGGCGLLMHVAVGAALASPSLAEWPRLPRIALGAMLAAFPGAALIGLLETLMRHNNEVFDHFLWFWFCVAAIGLPISLFHYARFASRPAKPPPVSQQDAPDSRFLSRLPREAGRDIVSISMQDHYVRVTTSRASVMILIRFSDAVRELAGYPGAQVHRSHWVASGQAKRILRDNKRTTIELADGRRLPVSRPYLAEAKQLVAVAVPDAPMQKSTSSTSRR